MPDLDALLAQVGEMAAFIREAPPLTQWLLDLTRMDRARRVARLNEMRDRMAVDRVDGKLVSFVDAIIAPPIFDAVVLAVCEGSPE